MKLALVQGMFRSDINRSVANMSLLGNRKNTSDFVKAKSAETNRLGELLVSAGIVPADRIPEALNLAKKSSQPVGRVLTMFGILTHRDLDSALYVQKLIRESQISKDLAVNALQKSAEGGQKIDEVLAEEGWRPKNYLITHGLGDLLHGAGLITRPQLGESVRMAAQAGIPLGRYLALTGIIATPVVFAALDAQIAMRDGRVTKEQAIRDLKTTAMIRTALPSDMFPQTRQVSEKVPEPPLRICELLSMAEIISDSDTLSAVELGLFKEQPVGQVLIELKLISDRLLAPALRLQELVRKNELRSGHAAQVLMLIHRNNMTMEAALEDMGLSKGSLQGWREALELLRRSGLLTEQNYQKAMELGDKNPVNVMQAVVSAGCVDESLLNAAMRSMQLLQANRLRLEQAIIALHHCARSRNSLDEAIRDLSFS